MVSQARAFSHGTSPSFPTSQHGTIASSILQGHRNRTGSPGGGACQGGCDHARCRGNSRRKKWICVALAAIALAFLVGFQEEVEEMLPRDSNISSPGAATQESRHSSNSGRLDAPDNPKISAATSPAGNIGRPRSGLFFRFSVPFLDTGRLWRGSRPV